MIPVSGVRRLPNRVLAQCRTLAYICVVPALLATTLSAAAAPSTKINLIAPANTAGNCKTQMPATATAENRWASVDSRGEAIRLAAGRSIVVDVYGTDLDQVSSAIVINGQNSLPLEVRLDPQGRSRRDAKRNLTSHCIEAGSVQLSFATPDTQSKVSEHKLVLKLSDGRETEPVKIQVFPLPEVKLILNENLNRFRNFACAGATGSVEASSDSFRVTFPAGAGGDNRCAAGELAGEQIMRLPQELGGHKYHFVKSFTQTFVASRESTCLALSRPFESLDYLNDPIGAKPIRFPFGPLNLSHQSCQGTIIFERTGGAPVAKFSSKLTLDPTPVFATGPVFFPRPIPARPGSSFRVTFNIGSPNPTGQLITYRLTDSQCFRAGRNTSYAPGLPFNTVTVPAERRSVTFELQVVPDAIERGCSTSGAVLPHALEAWAGNANLSVTANPFYINGPIKIEP